MTEIETITINGTTTYNPLSVIFICIFAGFLLYMFFLMSQEKSLQKKMKRAKRMINEGHSRAMHGKKNDGFYKETKRERTPEEKREWNEKIKKSVERDIKELM